ncbi:MAG: LicD family protein, partial [Cyanobacteria bacterium]|nr:LicD family protein [Cyanobacteriota bacterium]
EASLKDETGRSFSWSKVWLKEDSLYNNSQVQWGWPFIDLLWLHQTPEGDYTNPFNLIVYGKEDLFPTRLEWFEGKQFPCPNHAETILLKRHPYAFQLAIPLGYDHLNEDHNYAYQHIGVKLEALNEMYPILKSTLPRFQAFKSITL